MKMTIVDSNREYQKIELDAARTYLIGRSADCDIAIKANMVSRHHASVYFKDGVWRIRDNDSTNGTLLNGRKINDSPVNNYDTVRIGESIIEFNEEEYLQSIIIDGSKLGDFFNEEKIKNTFLTECQNKLDESFNVFKSIFENNGGQLRPEQIENSLVELHSKTSNILREFDEKVNKTNKDLKVLFELTKSISEILNLKQLLNIVLDLVGNIRNVERGLVLLYDPKTEKFIPYVTRKMSYRDIAFDGDAVSRSILDYMNNIKEPVLVKNSLTDERFISSESVVALNGKSILCIPIVSKHGDIHGAFYLEKSVEMPFDEDDVLFLKNFSGAVSVAVENAKLMMTIKKERHIRNNMERYISPNLIDQLTKTSGEIKLDGEKREITVLFADIKNFTKMSEQMSVENVFSMLNQVFSRISEIIFKHDGTLDKFIGDAVMAFFGAPVIHEDDTSRAVSVAVEIIETVEKMSCEFKKEFGVDLGFSIGVNLGEAIVGNIGSPSRMEYTAIGDTVNLAARLQANAGFNEILINETVYEKIKDKFKCIKEDTFYVKGKEIPVNAYKVVRN